MHESDVKPNEPDDMAKKSIDDDDSIAVDVDDTTEIEIMVSATLGDIINEGNELLEDLKSCASSIDEFGPSEGEGLDKCEDQNNVTKETQAKKTIDDKNSMGVDVADNTDIERMVSATLDDIINEGVNY